MQIGPETIRAIVERPLSQSEIEGLLRGLDEAGKAQLFFRMAELVRRSSAVADIFRSTPPAPDRDGVWTVQSKY